MKTWNDELYPKGWRSWGLRKMLRYATDQAMRQADIAYEAECLGEEWKGEADRLNKELKSLRKGRHGIRPRRRKA